MNRVKRIEYTNKCYKQLRKVPLEIKKAFRDRLELFLLDPYDPLLRNHDLVGNFKGHRSININGDWRAIFKESEEAIVFVALGTHSQLYR